MDLEFTFSCKTRGNAAAGGRPRVYFTCHPEDFARAFEKICADLFASQDCAVYYTEDMAQEIPEEVRETDLDRMNLFVVPVSLKLLLEPNRAMDRDVPFAFERHIPVLPILLEEGLTPIYSRPDRFGSLQYLNPLSRDTTEIAYEEKLKKYLASVLISDETAKRVRAAFDAYIFLSYRKKDRRLANDLLRRIHADPACRDIAVWYDEFLTPGESFKENIDRILRDSRLFTLLVTPNLLEEPNGRPNFVMGTEYPAARRAGLPILPAEMEETDDEALARKFEGLPPRLTPEDRAFFDRLLETVSEAGKKENDDEPEHNFLIGLAYLDGIDVEVDRPRAVSLITSAAEKGLVEAMDMLYRMYYDGAGVPLDWSQALHWAKQRADRCEALYGEMDRRTLAAQHEYGFMLSEMGEHKEALPLQKKTYALSCQVLGEKHPDTLTMLNGLALTYCYLGEHQKALVLLKKVYALRCEVLGEKHPDTLGALNNLAGTYGNLGEYQKVLTLLEKVYIQRCEMLGEKHPDTLTTLNNLAGTYYDLGEYQKALERMERVTTLRCQVLGKTHPQTKKALGNLSVLCKTMLSARGSLPTETALRLAGLFADNGMDKDAARLNTAAKRAARGRGQAPSLADRLRRRFGGKR